MSKNKSGYKNSSIDMSITEEIMHDDEMELAKEEAVPKLSDEDVEVVNTKTYHVKCPMLNVRTSPRIEDNIVHIVTNGTLMVVDENWEDPEWAKIVRIPEKISERVELYCMKKFLA